MSDPLKPFAAEPKDLQEIPGRRRYIAGDTVPQRMRASPYAAIAVAVVSVSFASIFITWSTSPPITIALYRLAFATALLFPFVLLQGAESLRALPRRDLLLMGGIGAILATHFALWIASLKVQGESIASSVVLVTSHPLLVGVLSHYVLKERLNRWMAVGIVAGFSGVVAIALADYGFSGSLLGADILAFLGGICAGFYFLLGRRLRQRVGLLDYAFVVYAAATGVLFLYAVLLNSSLAPVGNGTTEVLLFLALAVIPQIGGHTLYNWSLRWVPAPVVSLTLVGEPIGSSLLAWAILAQVPTVGVAVGAGLALFGIYMTVYGQGAQSRTLLATRDVE
jgi:drug/metabolite transporter (DMT)-like permease